MEYPEEPADGNEATTKGGGSRSEQIYRQLRTLLMDGLIAPTERLAEEALALRFEVSRTPIREALARLQVDGLVERRDGGLYLHVPSFDTVAGLYELRITLELRGIQRVMEDRSLTHDADMLRAGMAPWYAWRVEPPTPDAGFVDRDEAFHAMLLRSSGNPSLVDALVTVSRRIRPVRMYDYLTEDRLEATIREHIQISEFILDDDLGAALRALKEHVEESRDVVVDRAAKAMPISSLSAGYGTSGSS
jgi:DNA-binding GntR family transcriptional regulator